MFGKFVISLDYELAWGFHGTNLKDKPYLENVKGENKAVIETLKLFEKYGIHATWAIVGALFCKNKKELKDIINIELEYTKNGYTIEQYLDREVGENDDADSLHYAGRIIEIIKKYPYQEIASHTFSHLYCFHEVNDHNAFEKELTAFNKVAKDTKSLVFPSNQLNEDALNLLKKYNYKAYRGVQKNGSSFALYPQMADKEDFIVYKLLRMIDTYCNILGEYSYSQENIIEDNICNIRASAFFRGYNDRLSFLESLKIGRIKKGLRWAAQKNEIYHLWWHPHNFGINIQKNMEQLEEILRYFKNLESEYGMETRNMGEIADEVLPEK
ncbi:MAG: polysaccharide deacetylase family protein [Proteobacteria bacterium]|nr:polysaccharide deacetylase family protein [Pseudomonadota bacterium]